MKIILKKMTIESLIPKLRSSPILANVERIFGRTTDFIRGNPIVSTAAIGIGTTGLVAVAQAVRRKKKRKATRKTTRKKKKAPKKRKIKRKARRKKAKCPRKRKRKIIKHSGKGTKGKFKVVSFRDKKTGKMVRFKARR